MRIAYCFMVRDNVTQPKVWEYFFSQFPPTQPPIILSHAKYPEKTSTPFLKNALIPTYIQTQWGHVTLSLVMVFLAHYALTKYNADRIIFLSETCVPLQPPSHIEQFLSQSPLSWFNSMQMTHKAKKQRYTKLTNPKYISLHQLKKASQWCILNKADAKIIVKAAPTQLPNYKNQIATDEHYIITTLFLHYKNKYRFNEGMTTFVDWKRKFNYKHPHTFENDLTPEDIKLLTTTNCLFGRRFDASSNIATLLPTLWERKVTPQNITKKLPNL